MKEYKIKYRCFNCASMFTNSYEMGIPAPVFIRCPHCGVDSNQHYKVNKDEEKVNESVGGGKKLLFD